MGRRASNQHNKPEIAHKIVLGPDEARDGQSKGEVEDVVPGTEVRMRMMMRRNVH